MSKLVISAGVIGSTALGTLQRTSRGQVTGQTSGGAFLRTSGDRILFLSFASWRGPLTINLYPADKEKLNIELHSSFQIQAGAINFPESHLSVKFNHAACWSPPPRPPEALPLPERAQRFARILTMVRAALADRLESGNDVISKGEAIFDPGLSGLSAVRINLASSQLDRLIEALVANLGRGPGLTPAGDDVVLGFLLALNRWGDRLCPQLPPASINQALVQAARQRTTALSASLIECAAAGLADERLVAALDGLISGNLPEDRIVDHFRGWGHTSGAAALQGMGVALSENVRTC